MNFTGPSRSSPCVPDSRAGGDRAGEVPSPGQENELFLLQHRKPTTNTLARAGGYTEEENYRIQAQTDLWLSPPPLFLPTTCPLSPSSCRSRLPCSTAALTSPVSAPPQHPPSIRGQKLDSARSEPRHPCSFICLPPNLR